MAVPTVTINELSAGINAAEIDSCLQKVLIGILNDFMDLAYAKETDYTTGQRVLPRDSTIQDVDTASTQSTDNKFTAILKKISDVYKSGDLTPLSKNGDNGNHWDPKLHPVLVVVRPNP